MIAWTQLIRPDGVIVDLNGYQSIDERGWAGQSGDVNNHIPQILGATAMASLISAATGQFGKVSDNVILSALMSGTGSAVDTVAGNLLNNAINRQPTIRVEGGKKITVLVSNNFELTTYSL